MDGDVRGLSLETGLSIIISSLCGKMILIGLQIVEYFSLMREVRIGMKELKSKNNMPFFDGSKVFIFNGELQGVRINEQGRIGAEKVFNFVKRFDRGDTLSAIRQGVQLLTKKTQYVRAMNFIIAEQGQAWISTAFSENPGYFQMCQKFSEGEHVISSAPYDKRIRLGSDRKPYH